MARQGASKAKVFSLFGKRRRNFDLFERFEGKCPLSASLRGRADSRLVGFVA
jgi:hypothetical protein